MRQLTLCGILVLLMCTMACNRKPAPTAAEERSNQTQIPPAGPSGVAATGSQAGATAAPATDAAAQPASTEPSLVSFSSGALVVRKPQEFGESWSGFWMLDERPDSGWASPEGITGNQVMVIELPERTVLSTLEFDTGRVDGEGRGAKEVMVEMSDTSADAGFQKIGGVELADHADNQVFPTSAQVPGRWVRLTMKNNHGSPDYVEVMDFRARGKQLTTTPFPDISGTYDTNYGVMHLRQQGTSITGCYEQKQGVLDGGIEGRVMKLTWHEGADKDRQDGPAMMVFTPDGKQLFGLWWYKGQESQSGHTWAGPRKSNQVGSCPHWSGGAQEQMVKDLEEFGKTRVYGINFDSDSDRIKEESRPTLDKIVSLLKAKPEWKLTVEGHTDSTATVEHNQQLSEARAKAVIAYLVTAGIDTSRLTAAGYGASRPVAPNATAVGRAQNRRVELVKM